MYTWLPSLLFGSLLGLLPFAESENGTHPDKPVLKLIPEEVDFGLIFDGANPVKTVILRNEGIPVTG